MIIVPVLPNHPITDSFMDGFDKTYGYDGSGNLTTITATVPVNVDNAIVNEIYVKTYTWSGDEMTASSGWVKQ